MNKKTKSLILSAIFTIALLVVLFLNISLSDIATALRSIEIQYIVLGFICHAAAYFFRTWALFLFFRKEKIRFGYLLRIHFIHNFYVHVVPASLGEFSFPLLLKKSVPMKKSLAVLLVSRLAIMFLTVILFVVSVWFALDIQQFFDFQFKAIYLVLAGGIAAVLLVWLFRKQLLGILRKNQFTARFTEKIVQMWHEIVSEVHKLRNPLFTSVIFLLSLGSILSVSLFYLLILKGLDIQLSLFEIIFVSSIGMAFIVLPIKSIGGFGTTEGAWTLGLLILSVSKTAAIQSGFAIHIYALLNVVVLFVVGLLLNAWHKNRQTPFVQE